MSDTWAVSPLFVEPARPTVMSFVSGACLGSSSRRRIQNVRFLYSETSVPAFSGQKPCQFQPKPFQSLPSACHSRPTVLFTPSAAAARTVLLQPDFRLQFAHSFALPPFSSPSQTSSTSLETSTF